MANGYLVTFYSNLLQTGFERGGDLLARGVGMQIYYYIFTYSVFMRYGLYM